MKKNVLKILLALVMVAMVFALVACGGGDSGSSGGGKKNTGKDTDTNSETKVDAVAALTSAINEVVGGVAPYFSSLQAIKADSEVGVDIGVGGYYDNSGSKASAGNFKLTLQGNAKAEDPELKVAFSLDESKSGAGKDYVAIGYQDGSLYITEPLSLINAEKDSKGRSRGQPNSIKMDATMLKAGINNVAGFGMEKLEGVVGVLGDFNLDTTVKDILDKNESMIKMVAGFITPDTTSNSKEIALVITSTNVGKIIGAVSTFIDGWDDIIGTVDNVLATAYDSFGLYVNANTIGIDKEDAKANGAKALTFQAIQDNFMPAIKIIGGFDKDNTAADKALNAVKVELSLEQLNLAVGLAIDLRTLAIGKDVSISFRGYEPKNLTSSINVGLGQKDRFATLTATANTATAFKSKSTNVATAALKLGDAANKNTATANATYDGQDIYLDLTGISEIAGNYFDTSLGTKFVQKFTYGENAADFGKEEGNAFNVKEALAYMLEHVGPTATTSADAAAAEQAKADAEALAKAREKLGSYKTENIWATIYNIIVDIKEGYEYDVVGADGYMYTVNDEGTGYTKGSKASAYKTKAEQTDITKLLSEVEWIQKYVNVELVKSGKGMTFEQIGDSLKDKFDAVEAIFTGDDAAAGVKDGKASVALFSEDGEKDLIRVITMFINIPTVNDNNEFVKDDDGKFVVASDVKMTPALAKKYITAIFKLDDEDAAESYADWDADVKTVFGIGAEGFTTGIIETVLGIDLNKLCNGGIILYARYDEEEGLSGAIGIEDAEGNNYIEIGGSIGFIEAGEDLEGVADTETETPIATKTDDKWSMDTQIWKGIVDALNYVFKTQQA